MVVEQPKMIDMINDIKRHHTLSFEIIGIEVRLIFVFSEKRGSQNSVQISKNCNWKDLAAFYVNFFYDSHFRTSKILIRDHLLYLHQ